MNVEPLGVSSEGVQLPGASGMPPSFHPCPSVYLRLTRGRQHLALKHPNEALSASLRAYELAITQRSPSIPSIAATCLEAKKLRWESSERQRIARESALLRDMCDLIEKDAHEAMARVHDRSSSHEDDGEHGSLAAQEEIAAIEADACRRMRELEDVFGKAEANTLKRREVPDWAIDNITFGIMFDPVMVCVCVCMCVRR